MKNENETSNKSPYVGIIASLFLIGISYLLISGTFQTSRPVRASIQAPTGDLYVETIKNPTELRDGGKILKSRPVGPETRTGQEASEGSNESILKHKWRWPEDTRNKLINYAYKISSGDMKFIGTLEVENYMRSGSRRSLKRWANGYFDRGMCQINQGYHKDIVNNSRFWTDDFWQLEQCWKLYKEGTRFYGKDNYRAVLDRFIIDD